MSLGSLARRVLGKRLFAVAGRFYRAIFVDLDQVAEVVAQHVPERAHVLDIGGGDGALLNILLAHRADIRITLIDLSPDVGGAIEPRFLDRVTRLPGVSIRQYMAEGREPAGCVLLSDVVHHVPAPMREQFFADIRDMMGGRPVPLIVKDIEPGTLRANLSLWADRYISGDRSTSLVSRSQLQESVERVFGTMRITETPLLSRDWPNYALVFARP